MVDTLKLARRLEAAGLDRPVAEAMAEAFADSTVETVATKQDLREQVGILRAEIQASADTLRAEMQGMADGLNARMDGLAQSLRAEMQAFRWQVLGAVALMLLVHLGAVWGIVAAHMP